MDEKVTLIYKGRCRASIRVFFDKYEGDVFTILPFFGRNPEGKFVLGASLFEPGHSHTDKCLVWPLPIPKGPQPAMEIIRKATDLLGRSTELRRENFVSAYNAAFDIVPDTPVT